MCVCVCGSLCRRNTQKKEKACQRKDEESGVMKKVVCWGLQLVVLRGQRVRCELLKRGKVAATCVLVNLNAETHRKESGFRDNRAFGEGSKLTAFPSLKRTSVGYPRIEWAAHVAFSIVQST